MKQVRPLELTLRLYPRAWRERYGQEVRDLAGELHDLKGTSETRVALGLLWRAPVLWWRRGCRGVSRSVLAGTTAILVGAGVFVGVIVLLAPPAESSATTVPFTITSDAMAPTLRLHQTVQVKPFGSNEHIEPGEIVVFRAPVEGACGRDASTYLVKRIVALPGQTISLAQGHVVVDGKTFAEPWLPFPTRQATTPGPPGSSYDLDRPYRVPANRFFVLGDNRTDSCDSRYLGAVPRSLLYGAVVRVP